MNSCLVLLVLTTFLTAGFATRTLQFGRSDSESDSREFLDKLYTTTPDSNGYIVARDDSEELLQAPQPTRMYLSDDDVDIEARKLAAAFQQPNSVPQKSVHFAEQCIKRVIQQLRVKLNVVEHDLERCSFPRLRSQQASLTGLENPRDCLEIQLNHPHVSMMSGVFTIYPDYNGTRPRKVYCDMDTDGGGWTVIQHRGSGYAQESARPDFYRTYKEYEAGFGDASMDYWFGLRDTAILTNMDQTVLLVELVPWKDSPIYEKYQTFRISGPSDKYRLLISEASGPAGDSIAHLRVDPYGAHVYLNGMQFTTRDQDNDKSPFNCAVKDHGAWWYNDCQYSNLNGAYSTSPKHDGFVPNRATGMSWGTAPGVAHNNVYYSFRETSMKIRRHVRRD